MKKKLIQDSKKINKYFDKNFGKSEQSEQSGNYVLWHPHIYDGPGTGLEVSKEDIKDLIFRRSYDYKFSSAHYLIEQKKIEELVFILNKWVSTELFIGNKKYTNILETEIQLFLNEIRNNHYFAAAIMIGRTLEFLSISISEILNIKTENSFFADLEELKNKFSLLNDHAMEFEDASITKEEKKIAHLKKKIFDISNQITTKLNRFVSMIEYEKRNKSISPEKRYLDRMLKEIRKKYQSVEGVVHVFKRIKKNEYIKKILSIRNKAAHAPSKNTNNKIYKKDIYEMLHNFVSLIEELMALFLLIKKEKKYFQSFNETGGFTKYYLKKNVNLSLGAKFKIRT